MLVAVVSASSPGREPRIAVGGIVRLCEVYLPSTLVDGDTLAGYHHLMRVEGQPPGGSLSHLPCLTPHDGASDED